MNTESSDAEEIINMGSFRKGWRAELEARMRSEGNTVLTLGIIFGIGVVTGFIVTSKE